MTKLTRLWAGNVYGTSTGNLFLTLDENEGRVTGVARHNDPLFGLTVFDVVGEFGETLTLTGTPTQIPQNVTVGSVEMKARITPEGTLTGEWSTDEGSAGTFVAYPHTGASLPIASTSAISAPEQLCTASKLIGAVRIYGDGLWQIAERISRDMPDARMTCTYSVAGNEITRYVDEMKIHASEIPNLLQVRLMTQSPDAHGINKVISLDLSSTTGSTVMVQGTSEAWVRGNAENIADYMKQYEQRFVTYLKRYGVSLNQLIFMLMLVMLPAIDSLWMRAAFTAAIFFVLAGVYWIHGKVVPNALVQLRENRPNAFARAWPTILSWLIAITAPVLSAILLYLFTGWKIT